MARAMALPAPKSRLPTIVVSHTISRNSSCSEFYTGLLPSKLV